MERILDDEFPYADGILDGKTALVCGASKGIGRATALKFAQEHAAVVVVDKDPEGAEHTAELLGEIGAASAWFESDVSDNNQARLGGQGIQAVPHFLPSARP